MRRGKEIAQGSHASIAFMTNRMGQALASHPDKGYTFNAFALSEAEQIWCAGAFTKVCLVVNSEEELKDVDKRATEAGLECHMILDSGLTEFGGEPTLTCLAIGPDWSDKIDKVTGDLTLY